MLGSAADGRDLSGVDQREAELVAGAALYRMAGVVCCIAPDGGRLGDAARSAVNAATQAGLEVRALHGQHGDGWAAALPLCRLATRGAG